MATAPSVPDPQIPTCMNLNLKAHLVHLKFQDHPMTLTFAEPYKARFSGVDGLHSLLFRSICPKIGWNQGCELLPLPMRCDQEYIKEIVAVIGTYHPQNTASQVLSQNEKGIICIISDADSDDIVQFLVENPNGPWVIESLSYVARECPITLVRLIFTKTVFDLLGATIGIGQDLANPVRMVAVKKICRSVESKLAESAICDTSMTVRTLAMKCWMAQLDGFPEHYHMKATSLRLQLMCFDSSENLQQRAALNALTEMVSKDWTAQRLIECFEENFLANVVLIAKHDLNLQTRLAALKLIIALLRRGFVISGIELLLQTLFLGVSDRIFGTERVHLLTILDLTTKKFTISSTDTDTNCQSTVCCINNGQDYFQESFGEREIPGHSVIMDSRKVLGLNAFGKSSRPSESSRHLSKGQAPAIVSVICQIISDRPLCFETVRLTNFLPQRLVWLELCNFISTENEKSLELQVAINLLRLTKGLEDTSVSANQVWKVIDAILSKSDSNEYVILMVSPLVNCDPESIHPETESPELLHKFYKAILLTGLDIALLNSQIFTGPMKLVVSKPSCKRAFLSVYNSNQNKIRHEVMATISKFPWDEEQLESKEDSDFQRLCILLRRGEEYLRAANTDDFLALSNHINAILSNNTLEDVHMLSEILVYMGRLNFVLEGNKDLLCASMPKLSEPMLEQAVEKLINGDLVLKGFTEWFHCQLAALESLDLLGHQHALQLQSGVERCRIVEFSFK